MDYFAIESGNYSVSVNGKELKCNDKNEFHTIKYGTSTCINCGLNINKAPIPEQLEICEKHDK